MEKNNSGESDIQVFDEPASKEALPANGELTIGLIAGFDSDGKPLLTYKNGTAAEPVAAVSTVSLHSQHIGRQVAILFIDHDASKPVIVGLIRSHLDDLLEAQSDQDPTGQPLDSGEKVVIDGTDKSIGISEQNLYVDGKKIHIEGKEEIVLSCGESSITLTRSGKILIRGKYLLNRSSGVNRIMGGSVQVN